MLRKIYGIAFVIGVLAAISAMSGWTGTTVPYALLGITSVVAFFDRNNNETDTPRGVLYLGLAVLLATVKISLGWIWPVWIPVLVLGYMGVTQLMSTIDRVVTAMYRA